jgi:hypothetical protein
MQQTVATPHTQREVRQHSCTGGQSRLKNTDDPPAPSVYSEITDDPSAPAVYNEIDPSQMYNDIVAVPSTSISSFAFDIEESSLYLLSLNTGIRDLDSNVKPLKLQKLNVFECTV